MSRQLKLTTELQDKLVAYIRAGNYVTVAAACCGIHKDTFYDWMKQGRAGKPGTRFARFAEAVDLALAHGEALNLATIRAASASSWQAAAWILERRNPDRWGRKERTELTGAHGGPIQHVDLTNLTDEELARLSSGHGADIAAPQDDGEVVE